jgi:hypothetical protein
LHKSETKDQSGKAAKYEGGDEIERDAIEINKG